MLPDKIFGKYDSCYKSLSIHKQFLRKNASYVFSSLGFLLYEVSFAVGQVMPVYLKILLTQGVTRHPQIRIRSQAFPTERIHS